MGFGDSVRAFGTKSKAKVSEKIITIAGELFEEVVKGTPVDKGVLKNNWYAGTNGRYDATYNANSASLDGMSSLTQISTLKTYMGFLGRDGSVSLSNSTPYGFRAEYDGWPSPEWSGRIGPYAMIAKAFITVVPKYK